MLPAHPFGPPLVATLAADGEQVTLQWEAADDDWVSLGEHVGAFDVPDADSLTGAELLAQSPGVTDYLLEHLTVTQDGAACAGRIDAIDPLGEGARLVFDCAAPVTEVELTVSALTDINESYRTVVSTEGSEAQTLFTAGTATQPWDFTAGDGTSSGLPLLIAAGALLLIGAVAGVLWWRRSAAKADASADAPDAHPVEEPVTGP
ncbi:hypothetical protein [Jiangella alkaliphila]|uniref:Uncharacterized protein n=1 Tax=Jiangella alkaliphila TaxID=419479 RepID=A0A1H2L604_9ACTN|nr:hypothetical protein [Jiangella alkaliphila]SDU76470.1 hypothetical protein SAMN04488563_5212 [Jiangella alkaliphila]